MGHTVHTAYITVKQRSLSMESYSGMAAVFPPTDARLFYRPGRIATGISTITRECGTCETADPVGTDHNAKRQYARTAPRPSRICPYLHRLFATTPTQWNADPMACHGPATRMARPAPGDSSGSRLLSASSAEIMREVIFSSRSPSRSPIFCPE